MDAQVKLVRTEGFLSRFAQRSASRAPLLGSLPLLPTYCTPPTPGMEAYYVLLGVNGVSYAVVLDTGSSNLVLAGEPCSSCDLAPKVPALNEGVVAALFNISYGTGGVQAEVAFGGLDLGPDLHVQNGSYGLIVRQFTSFGFNMFPPKGNLCYNTYAGVLGLAYSGQAAGPGPGGTTTNGTTTPLLDQLVARGLPNAFAIEACLHYPVLEGECDAHHMPGRQDNLTWEPSSDCGKKSVGNLMLGGWASDRLAEPVKWTPAMSEIHYDVQMLGVRVCGGSGCTLVSFPDPMDGSSEDDCTCSTPTCAAGGVSFCSFAVVDSGAGRMYMNTVRNAVALLDTMAASEMVEGDTDTAFWYNQSASLHAVVRPGASIAVLLPRTDGKGIHEIKVDLDAVFRNSKKGLVQIGITGNLDYIVQAQANKFPTLLGATLLQGKTVIFDRSRRQIGFAESKDGVCTTPVSIADMDSFGANSDPTPGIGCLRGTGNGGGCPQ
ncbi:unnamed protein product [Polarella glacialis]|uniref:Peptidase A1 domain-containing protein n=1 Tax=Polarella glacialis TaxID=89957 RepID=A0A813FZ97_POLGL|nr:unnamed protein product [Polarella glacialis]